MKWGAWAASVALLWALPGSGAPGTTGPAWAGAVQQAGVRPEGAYGCIRCHSDKRRAFLLGVHSERGIRCHDCHGGNPASFDRDSAHSGNYVGAPDKIRTVQLCASCHSDPDRMRQYGLPAGQLAEFRTSRHGRLLLEQRNTDAPTCTDCHDAHTILRPDDARSTVHPMNLSTTCARCHEDGALMGKYGLPTDQVEQHRKSAHGVALFDRQNFAAPTCVGCHGSHAALPPAVFEIANVCGRCHVWVRREFYQGPHGEAALTGTLPGCTACHSNHGTEGVPPREIAATCARCHDPSSSAALVGLEVQKRVIRASEDLRAAQAAIRELVRNGQPIVDVRFRYQTALTAYLHMGHAQHRLDLERLDEFGRQVGSGSRAIRSTAEVGAERRWEHKLVLVPVWFLALSAVVLAWFKLRGLGAKER